MARSAVEPAPGSATFWLRRTSMPLGPPTERQSADGPRVLPSPGRPARGSATHLAPPNARGTPRVPTRRGCTAGCLFGSSRVPRRHVGTCRDPGLQVRAQTRRVGTWCVPAGPPAAPRTQGQTPDLSSVPAATARWRCRRDPGRAQVEPARSARSPRSRRGSPRRPPAGTRGCGACLPAAGSRGPRRHL